MARRKLLGMLLGACLLAPAATAGGAPGGNGAQARSGLRESRRARAELSLDRTSFIPQPGRLTIKYEVHNAGPDESRRARFEDVIRADLQSIAQVSVGDTRCRSRLGHAGATVRCELDAIPPGGGVTVFVNLTAKAIGSLDVAERAEVRAGDEVDPAPGNNQVFAGSNFVRERASGVGRRSAPPRPPAQGQGERRLPQP
jgi:hypothetical protein